MGGGKELEGLNRDLGGQDKSTRTELDQIYAHI